MVVTGRSNTLGRSQLKEVKQVGSRLCRLNGVTDEVYPEGTHLMVRWEFQVMGSWPPTHSAL